MSRTVMSGNKLRWIAETDAPDMPQEGEVGIVINDRPRTTELIVKWTNGLLSTECDLDENHLWELKGEEWND
jgi:hypothetical protein